jgi:hypothetical protein
MDKEYPHVGDNDICFLDFNPTLPRVYKRGWSTNRLATLVGSARIMSRRRCNKQLQYRILTGYELMSIVGWHESFYTDLGLEHNATLVSLAGNAYSGFAILPLLVCIFSFMWKFEILGVVPAAESETQVTIDSSCCDDSFTSL